MTLKADPPEEIRRKIADMKAGRPVQPTKTPVETFTDAPKGKGT